MSLRRALGALALILVAAGTSLVRAGAPAGAVPQSPEPAAWIVVDADTGAVLAAREPHLALPPASTAKIMTALAAVERLPPDATIPVSELAASQPPSKISMLAGEEWRFADTLASLVMVSANDAAYALAEAAGGSLQGFADALNATAVRYGMQDSRLSDPAGFDDEASFQGGPRMSAFDIAIATRNALAVPEIAALAAAPELRFTDPAGTERYLPNHNKLLDSYEGANGFKTGYTRQAGHTLVATATRAGRTMIAVILNTYDTYGWAAQLLDQGFASAPQSDGTGERLPEVRVSTWSQRQADLMTFTALARGGDEIDAAAAAAAGEPAAQGDAGAGAPAAPLAASAEAATTDEEPAEAGGGRGILTLRNVGLGVLAVLVVLVALRRRAVRRQRARRRARQRATAELMRRGSLPVVDGRYRAGTRVGPPLPSHVTVRRLGDDERPRGGTRA